MKPTLRIEYCAPCNYLPRTLWQVSELMQAIGGDLAGVELVPAGDGVYRVSVGEHLLFSKKDEGRFPEPSELLEAAFAVLGQSSSH